MLNLKDYDKRCIILKDLEKAKRTVPEPALESPVDHSIVDHQIIKTYTSFMDKTNLYKLQADIKQSEIFKTNHDLKELLNLTELRQITTVFIKVPSLQRAESDEFLPQAQSIIEVVQKALSKNNGSLRQIHVDDKGAVILCFFGLPPLANDNDSRLGVSAAIDIRENLKKLVDQFSIGITSGVVSYGGVGVIGRAEYAVVINL
jgi:hypothetical protein